MAHSTKVKGKRRTSIQFSSAKGAVAISGPDAWVGAKVWYRDNNQDSLWQKAVVKNCVLSPELDAKGEAHWIFDVEDISSQNVVKVDTVPMSPENLEFTFIKRRDEHLNAKTTHDMTSLSYLNEPELLECVYQRYMDTEIYTSIGPILLALNPFERLPIYDGNTLEKYNIESQRSGQLPHIFQTANRAYYRMLNDKFRVDLRENQAILISGESGAGKTESTKHVLHFLAVISSEIASQMANREELNDDIETQIVASNPILESFGNAKTNRNNNSSRFGKFIELSYTTDGYIDGGKIRTYLLETVRVASQIQNERNYHVFYEVAAGLDPKLKEKYGFTALKDFHFTNQSGEMNRHDGESDADNYAALRDAMNTLDIDDELQDRIEQLVVAILHIGNLAFQDSSKAGEDAAEFKADSRKHVGFICQLLEISEDTLITAVARRSVTVVGNTIEKTLNAEAATFARNTLAKFLYSTMFQWIVNQINHAMGSKTNASVSFIGVLDIFGFEHFVKNSFEQLCINYTNEKLQDHFNFSIFKAEQEVYKEEGLKWTFVDYPDNSARLELLEHSTTGIFSVCSEQLRIPKCSDEKLAIALYQRCGSHPYFAATKVQKGKSEFTVLHYARNVTYQAEGFLDKNRSETAPELYNLIRDSNNKLIEEFVSLYPEIVPKMGTTTLKANRSSLKLTRTASNRFNNTLRKSGVDAKDEPAKKAHVKETVKKVTSVAAQFSHQLTELMTKIRSTRSHFVCCIKPNLEMKPKLFNVSMCTDQLRCGGALGAIQVFRAGFPNRMSFEAFVTKFSSIAFIMGKNILTREFQEALQHARITGSIHAWKAAAGILIRLVPLAETVVNSALNEFLVHTLDVASEMQMGMTQIFLRAPAFEYLERQHQRVRNYTARRLQLRWRAWRLSKQLTSQSKKAALAAIRHFSDFRRRMAIRRLAAIVAIQRRAKVYLAVSFRKFMLRAISKFQGIVRGSQYRAKARKRRQDATLIIQSILKANVCRKKYRRYRKALLRLQSRFRGKRARKSVAYRRHREKRGLWAVIQLQALARGQFARSYVQGMKRQMIAKRFEDQMKAAQRKQELLDTLQRKLEQNPNILDELSNSADDTAQLHKQVETLRARVTELEAENIKLRKALKAAEAKSSEIQATQATLSAAGKPAEIHAPVPVVVPTLVQSHTSESNSILEEEAMEWKRKALALEEENQALKREQNRAALFDQESRSLLSYKITPNQESIRKLNAKVLHSSLSSVSEAESEEENPDWVKKYSDQHKRFYWRHKVTGKTTWTAPMRKDGGGDAPTSVAPQAPREVSSNVTSAPSVSLSPSSSGVEANIAIDRLIKGWLVTKLSSTHYPKERAIFVDPVTQVLVWRKDVSPGSKVDGSISLDAVKRITRGKKSRTLEKVKGIDESLCLSIHYLNTSLDLQLASESERDMMFIGLKELIKVE